MTQKDKNLLFKDLCARLPYGVKGLHRGEVHELFTIDCREANNACIQVDGYDAWFSVDTFKPYLRPMSSMTDEEKKELGNYVAASMFASQNESPFLQLAVEALYGDFFERHHIDYRRLIENGLALEAPEDMYKI